MNKPPQTYVTVGEQWEFIEPSEEEIATGDPSVLRKLAFPDMMNKETGEVVIAKWENIEPLLRLADELGELQIEEWKPTIN